MPNCILSFWVMHFSSDDKLNLICLTVTFSNISGFAATFIMKSIPWKITCILWFVINQNKKLKVKYFPAIKRIKPTLQSELKTRTNKIKELISKSKHGLMNVNLLLDPVCRFTSKLTVWIRDANPRLLITCFSLHLHITMLQLQIQIDVFFIFRDVSILVSAAEVKKCVNRRMLFTTL